MHPVQLRVDETASDESTQVVIKPRKNEGKCSLGLQN